MRLHFQLVLILLLTNLNSYSQVALENTYANNGFFKKQSTPGYGLGLVFGNHSFYMVHLEYDGDKYVHIDRVNQSLIFYNLNHTVFKTINYPSVYTGIGMVPMEDKLNCSILYISQNLFHPDSAIEFLYSYNRYNNIDTSWRAITHIVNESGTIVFSDSAAPFIKFTVHNQYYPVYNTTGGTKLILSNINGTAEVFSLPGTFTTAIAGNNILNEDAEMNIFPNPSFNQETITVNYKLPAGIKSALLMISDGQSSQVKSYEIGNMMDYILLPTSEFPTGIYYYTILSKDGRIIQTKKSINIR